MRLGIRHQALGIGHQESKHTILLARPWALGLGPWEMQLGSRDQVIHVPLSGTT